MSFLDALFGRTKPAPSKPDDVFAISTAYVTLQANLGLQSDGKAAVCFKPVTSSAFGQVEKELDELLQLCARGTSSTIRTSKDEYGFRWVVVEDPEFEDLVNMIYTVSQTLQEQGFGDQLLAAVFRFHDTEARAVFWIYNYKRGKFYPFVPAGRGMERDNATELHLSAVIGPELPVDPETERWYALWGMPIA